METETPKAAAPPTFLRGEESSARARFERMIRRVQVEVCAALEEVEVQKQPCDKFDASFYPRFKKWCDDYFHIKHRGERRGVGGIFFDDLNDYDQETLLEFAAECADSVIPAYIPIIERRKDTPFTEGHKAWQQIRRGRYVEFNLVYDRGTTFGLKTGGRIESILVSLPLTARWEYDHKPEVGTEEWKLLDVCINPKEWI